MSRLNRKQRNRGNTYPTIVVDITSSRSHELKENIDGEPGRTHKVTSYSGIVGDLQDPSRECHVEGLNILQASMACFIVRLELPTSGGTTTMQINADARNNDNTKER